ncbi:peptidoglycan DD-metalloendopeptidase family protein [Kiloniella sp. b19]|uniref:peptidoglycan DD-metalloendopeptidase family protein n=1 Tax=Kiloniella sp. GXU_MW_B19 TaxID=3141326 RepID=UPI0031D93B90
MKQGTGRQITSKLVIGGLTVAGGVFTAGLLAFGSLLPGLSEEEGASTEVTELLNELDFQSIGVQPTAPRPTEIAKTVTVSSGDTLMNLLVDAGVKRTDAYRAIQAMEPVYSSRKIKPGFEIDLKIKPEDAEELLLVDAPLPKGSAQLLEMSFAPDVENIIQVAAYTPEGSDDFSFSAEGLARPLEMRETHSEHRIENSLYQAAVQAGLPNDAVGKLIRIYSYDVDFQREIQKGDSFEVVFEGYYDDNGNLLKTGDILYGKLTLSGTELPLYRFTNSDGFEDYYDEKGQSVKKALMRTPIDGARLSSGFGRRKHPVLGYTKMHKGVDFAAPRGTPIYAAGDGVVERANRFSSYGNYIRIRHHSGFKTAYAHLKGFAKGITANKRVKQGQVIGYVGTTGRSTGPHLHYELLKNGKQVNPLSVKIPAGDKLRGKDKTRFAAHRDELDGLRTQLVQMKQAEDKLVSLDIPQPDTE